MRQILLGEAWESFFIEGHKVGFLRRVTSVAENPNIIVSTLDIVYGAAKFKHVFSFFDEPGYPPHSYLFDSNDGAPVHVRFASDEMICQVDDDIFTEKIPSGTRPRYGNYPLVVTMPFEEGFIITYSQMEDSACVVDGRTELISYGWENVKVRDQDLRLWLVSEYINHEPCNRYWLDKNRRVRKTQWRGAISYWEETKEEALRDLPNKFKENAKEILSVDGDSDWIGEIERWLVQNGK